MWFLLHICHIYGTRLAFMNNFGITGENKKIPERIIRSLKHNVLEPTCNGYKFDAFNLAVKLAFVSVCTIAIYRKVGKFDEENMWRINRSANTLSIELDGFSLANHR